MPTGRFRVTQAHCATAAQRRVLMPAWQGNRGHTRPVSTVGMPIAGVLVYIDNTAPHEPL